MDEGLRPQLSELLEMKKIISCSLLLSLIGCGGGSSAGTSAGTGGSTSQGNFPSGSNYVPPAGALGGFRRILELMNIPAGIFSRTEILPQLSSEENAGTQPWISDDGRIITFLSTSTQLVPGVGDGSNGKLYLKDRLTGSLISYHSPHFPPGIGSYQLSQDRRWVGFNSPQPPPGVDPSHTPFLYFMDWETGEAYYERGFLTDVSPDGRYCAFWTSGAPNRSKILDRQTGQTIQVAPHANGTSLAGQFSRDSSKLYFFSDASNLVENDLNDSRDLFCYRISDGQISLVSRRADGQQFEGEVASLLRDSADGRSLVFSCNASNAQDLHPVENGIFNVYLKDLQTGEVQLISRGLTGAANGDSYFADISADGRRIAFRSSASNLVAKDTNEISDVFVFNRDDGSLGRVNLTHHRREAARSDDRFGWTRISGDGQWVTFTSESDNMMPGISGGFSNVYLTSSQPVPLFEPPGPHPDPTVLSLTGTANLDTSPFRLNGQEQIDGEFIPQIQNATFVHVNCFQAAANSTRQLSVTIAGGGTPLTSGRTFTPKDPFGTQVTFQYFDALAPEIVNGMPATRLFRSGNSGMLTFLGITPGAGNGTTLVFRLDDWEMVPGEHSGGTPSGATGSFLLNGTLTLRIP